jgi:long-chain acyl-CoA synthetase
VSSNGKKIYPARIEALLKTDPLINQVVLLGDRQPYVTALFTINPAAAEALDETQRGRPVAEIASTPAVLEQLKRTVSKVNKQLAPFEHVKRWKVLERDFSIDSGELTPTMKVRRQQVVQNFRETINELYLGREELA